MQPAFAWVLMTAFSFIYASPVTIITSPCDLKETLCESTSTSHSALFTCANPELDVENCGGCSIAYGDSGRLRSSTEIRPLGRNCLTIPGLEDALVRCISGTCKITQCQPGWKLSPGRESCQELFDEGD